MSMDVNQNYCQSCHLISRNGFIISRARILGKMDYFYFLRHMYETCL
jgi:hypothetical protein